MKTEEIPPPSTGIHMNTSNDKKIKDQDQTTKMLEEAFTFQQRHLNPNQIEYSLHVIQSQNISSNTKGGVLFLYFNISCETEL